MGTKAATTTQVRTSGGGTLAFAPAIRLPKLTPFGGFQPQLLQPKPSSVPLTPPNK